MKKHQSGISWTEVTWNPWIGCQYVSAGCENCYMFREQARFGQDGANIRKAKNPSTATEPLRYKNPSLIFTCSFSDFFIKEADQWRPGIWDVIEKTPQHRYQILSKRPQRVIMSMPPGEYSNVWLGVSVEDNKSMSRLRYFSRWKDIHVPVKFVSFEPLIDEIDVRQLEGIYKESPWNWAIIGGESGNEPPHEYTYRYCEAKWIQQLVDFHVQKGVPVFVKQTGTYLANFAFNGDRHGTKLDTIAQVLGAAYARQEMPANFYRWKADQL